MRTACRGKQIWYSMHAFCGIRTTTPYCGRERDSIPAVGAYIAADPDYPRFFSRLAELIDLLLPRFVQEGKKYTTITIGCTGGSHRSVYLVEQLAAYLGSRIAVDPAGGGIGIDWQLNVTHRELARDEWNAVSMTDRPVPRRDGSDNGEATRPSPVQAQEA